MKYLKSYEHITFDMAKNMTDKEIKALYVKDYTNAVNRLNKMFNTLGFQFEKEKECPGLRVYMDLTIIEGSVMSSILEKYQKDDLWKTNIYPGDQKYNHCTQLEILTKGGRKEKNTYTRFRITPICDDDIIDDTINILIGIFNQYKYFSGSGWPRRGIATIDYLNKLIKNCLYNEHPERKSNNFDLTEEDALDIYKDIANSNNAFKVLKNIKKDIPELWNILKKFTKTDNIDTGTQMGELGF